MQNVLINAALTPEGFQSKSKQTGTIVVVDVLRASSSIITALSNGAVKVIPAESKEEALSVGGSLNREDILYCGEREGFKIDGFDMGNSPREYLKEKVGGKVLVFSSTNGSKMIANAVKEKHPVLIAGFLNVDATARRIVRSAAGCLVVCAGREGQFSLEDAVCAGMLAVRIRAGIGSDCTFSDEARSAAVLYRHFADDLLGMARDSFHGRYLSDLGLGEDVPYCASVDRFETVPVFENGALIAG
jgi:2-phosphosulfolactate phosphatase